MWPVLSKKTQLSIIVAAAILSAWAADGVVSFFVNGAELGVLKQISIAITFVGTVLVLVANRYWRWVWQKAPSLGAAVFPDLNGTWNGQLISTWINPETQQAVAPIPTTVWIKQGLFDTHISLKTGESKSESTRVILEPSYGTKKFRIWYSYNNDPQAQFQHRSSPHEGIAFLELDLDADPNCLTGRYYTARKTTGDMVLNKAL